MDNLENKEEIKTIQPSRRIFGKIFTIIAYIVVFALGYQMATISYTKEFGNVSGMTISKMNKIEKIVKENYYKGYDRDKLYDYAESFMVYGLEDPFSYYLDEDGQEEFKENIEGNYVGVGITLTPGENGEILVIAPFDGSPASEAGIMKNDIITKVNGTAYSYAEVDKAIELMKGKPGEEVNLEIKRGNDEIFNVNLKKAEIVYKSVTAEKLEDNIVYVRISRFDLNTFDDFVKELSALEITEETELILDLRDNPGGTVVSAVAIADLFIDEGVIVTEDYKNKKDIVEKATDGHIKMSYPFVILTNESSASASEIVSGALKDHKKAVLIGEKTFGKGLINQAFPLDNESSIVLSVAQYETPDGTKIHGVGISPDVEIPFDYQKSILTLDKKDDIQLIGAIEYIKGKQAEPEEKTE
ncbi:MAG: S41 family peptidase [Ruminococcaceae bacterium]|nr:S41 family peptidase [Oscillospiraceae bacterium]